MILQSLVEYYEALELKGDAVGPGYGKEDISYALEINDAGELVNVISLKLSAKNGSAGTCEAIIRGKSQFFIG